MVTIISLPMSMGYGILAFSSLGGEFVPMAAIAGVYAAVFAGFFASLFGGSPIQITGPGAPLTLVLGTFVAGLVSNPTIPSSPAIVLGLASLCVLTAGCIQVVLGFLGFSNLVKYIPQPVVSGFMNGIALLIIFGQTRLILGVNKGTSFFDIFNNPVIINPITTAAGIITILSSFGSKRFFKGIPPSLTALITGTGSYYVLTSFFPEFHPGQVIGPLQTHFPIPNVFLHLLNEMPTLPIQSILSQLLVTSLILALIGSMESMLCAVGSDHLSGTRHNSKRVVLGLGIGNIAGALFGAIASTGSIIRSTVNYKAGGRTSLSGMLSSFFVLLMILFFGSYAGKIPITVVAGIIFVVGLNIFDKWTLNIIKKFFVSFTCQKEARVDIFINFFVAAITISINLIVAVGIGMLVASALFISKIARSVIKRQYVADRFHSHKMRQTEHIKLLEKKGGQISVFQLQGPIFFGSAEHLAEEIQRAMIHATFIILDFKLVTEIDSTGAAILFRLKQNITKESKHLLFSYLQNNKSVWTFLEVMEVTDKLAKDVNFSDTDLALEWAEDCLICNEQLQQSLLPEFFLAKVSLFENFTDEEIEAIQTILVYQTYAKGDVVFRENDHCRDLYILIKGFMTVSIYLPERNRYKRLYTYSSGSVFGEMTFLDDSPRSADVWAHEDSAVFRLNFFDFELLRKEKPEIANKLFKNIALEISYYLRRSTNQLRELEDN